MSFCNDKVTTINLGQAFDSEALGTFLSDNYRAARYREAWHLPFTSGEAWAFRYGVVVFWAVSEDERQSLLHRLQPFISGGVGVFEQEDYRFVLSAEQPGFRQDTIALADNNPLSRLAISHALAQSLQLNVFEGIAQRTIIDTAEIPQALARTGRIPLKRRDIARIRGQLFATKSDIILHYNLLDTPEFFWEYPELDPLYTQAARYLDIRSRVEVLSQKLGTIHELFEMLADEEKHRHSAYLEWIIIILIALEIVLFGYQELFGH